MRAFKGELSALVPQGAEHSRKEARGRGTLQLAACPGGAPQGKGAAGAALHLDSALGDTLGPVLSIWPAAPVRSPSQQDQHCGGRAEALNRVVHASVKSGGGDSGAGTRGRRPWPPGSRLLQQQKGTRFLLQASVPGTAPAPPGERGPLSSGAEPWLETQAPAAWHTCAAAACTSAQQAPGVLGVRSGRWGSLGTPHRTHHVSDSQQPLHMWPGSKPRALR